jgi:exopolysaccharide production protein ExoQ
MVNGSLTKPVFAVAALAFVAGMGVAYAPVPTFVGVAAVFLLALWALAKHRRLRHSPFNSPFNHGSLEGITQGSLGDIAGRLVPIFLLIWWSAVLWTNRVGTNALIMDEWTSAQTTQQAAAQGSLPNQLLVVSYGAVGMFFLVSAIKRSSGTLRWVLALWLLYLCWGYISLLWSVDPSISVRRLIAFTLISLGSIGFGAGFYGGRPDGRNLLLRHAVLAGILAALALLIPFVLRGNVGNLLDPTYVLRPAANTYSYVALPALVASLIMIATSTLHLRQWRRYDWVLISVLGLAIFVLKTRGPFLSAVLALSIVYLCYKIWVGERLLPIGVLLTVAVGAYVLYAEEALDWLIPYLTRGASPELTYSLTGRVQLWDALLFDVKQHLLSGVGFGAYWNPVNLGRLQQTFGHAAVVAHNGYIDELLATGIIGLTLLLVFWSYTSLTALGRIRHGDNFAWLVVLFVLFYLLHNVTSSLMQLYLEVPFIVLLALVGLMGSRPATKLSPYRASNTIRGTVEQARAP